MDESTGNEAEAAPESVIPEQTQEVQAPEAAGQAAPAVTQAQGIVVGNQTFQTQDELAKAYADLQRGYTQHTQKSAKELEAYKATTEWLQGLKRDPQKWDRFITFVNSKGEVVPQGTPGAQAVPAGQPAANPEQDRFRADIEGRLEAQHAQLEYLQFRHSHKDLDDSTVAKVIDQVDTWGSEGKDRSMEEAYRWILAEENLSRSFQAGQRTATAAAAASKAAGGVLGGTAPAAQSQVKPEKKYKDMKTVDEQNAYIRNALGQFKKSK